MSCERNHLQWKLTLARHGPAGLFGPQTAERRALNGLAALVLFARVWRERLGPAVRAAPPVSAAAARVLLPDWQRARAADGDEYRLVDAGGGAFVARLVAGAGANLECHDLWEVGDECLDRQLVVWFPNQGARERFEVAAGRLGREAGDLALELATEFAAKFPSPVAPADRVG